MHVEHFEKGVTYTDKELVVLAKKLGKLATYCHHVKDEAAVIRVEAEQRPTKKANDEVKVMLTVEVPGKVLRAESRKAAIMEAFDRAVEKMEPQLIKYKEMHSAKGRQRKARGEQVYSQAA